MAKDDIKLTAIREKSEKCEVKETEDQEDSKGYVLLDFSLTVKVATLIFISGCGSAFYLLRKGNQVLFIIW